MTTSLLKSDGRLFPSWLDVTHPEARRGTVHVRTVDPNLTVGLDTRRGVFMLWGPSVDAGGWIPLADCQDDSGRPFRGLVPWGLIVAGIRRQLDDAERGIFVPDRAAAANERLHRDADRRRDEELTEAASYFHRAFAQEADGALRYGADDVAAGWRHARDGARKAPPVGRKHFVGAGAPPGD